MTYDYRDIPLEHSEYGEQLYEVGRRLVGEAGVRLHELVWDADEVLWDWLMDARRMFRAVPTSLLPLDFGHREYYLVKPGVFELIWGMHHASLELGLDPHMRIWTNGYPWRIWRVAQEIPGFARLVGAPAEEGGDDHEAFSTHPRIFYRTDYARLAHRFVEPQGRTRLLADLPAHVRALIESQLGRNPFDSSFKLPEFAALIGKEGFGDSKVLVDDTRPNIRRFVASGRHGVHVISHSPRLVFGTVPNTVWGGPHEALQGLANEIAVEIASALERIAQSRHPVRVAVESKELAQGHAPLSFSIDIPDRMIRAEWIDPIKELKQAWQASQAV